MSNPFSLSNTSGKGASTTDPKQEAGLKGILFDFAKQIGLKQMAANEHIKDFYQIDDKSTINVEAQIGYIVDYVNAHTTKLLKEQLDRLESEKESYVKCLKDENWKGWSPDIYPTEVVPLTAIENERKKLDE